MPVRVPRLLVAVLPLAAMSMGCLALKKDVERVNVEVASVEERVGKLENDLEQDSKHLSDMIARARKDVTQLEETLNRATRVLARNSADFGADMESFKTQLAKADGALAELRYSLDDMGRRVDVNAKRVNDFALAAGLDLPVDETRVPADKAKHFQLIKEAFVAQRFGEVRALGDVYAARYETDPNADDVLLMSAKSYSAQKRWAKALGVLRGITDKYPKSELLPEVLFEMASAFFLLGDCTDASILVETLTTRHKASPFAEKGRQLGSQVRKQKARCTS